MWDFDTIRPYFQPNIRSSSKPDGVVHCHYAKSTHRVLSSLVYVQQHQRSLDRQFVTYDHALIEAPDSNAIDSIKPDLHEENCDHSFPETFVSFELLSDEDHRLTLTFLTDVWFQDHNDETMIHHQS